MLQMKARVGTRVVVSLCHVFVIACAGRTALGQNILVGNTDAGRPFRVEDALALPRYALDLHLMPDWSGNSTAGSLSLRSGAYYGIVPRTQIDVELPVVLNRTGNNEPSVAGVRLGAQHALNVERRMWPAVALDASVLLPAGAVRRSHPSLKGIATKTFKWARLNISSESFFGGEPLESDARPSLARWETGVAVDRLFPRSAFLLGGELVARQPLDEAAPVRWSAGVGARYQLTPSVVLDGRLSRDFTGSPQTWGIALAASRSIPMSALLPGLGQWGRS